MNLNFKLKFETETWNLNLKFETLQNKPVLYTSSRSGLVVYIFLLCKPLASTIHCLSWRAYMEVLANPEQDLQNSWKSLYMQHGMARTQDTTFARHGWNTKTCLNDAPKIRCKQNRFGAWAKPWRATQSSKHSQTEQTRTMIWSKTVPSLPARPENVLAATTCQSFTHSVANHAGTIHRLGSCANKNTCCLGTN